MSTINFPAGLGVKSTATLHRTGDHGSASLSTVTVGDTPGYGAHPAVDHVEPSRVRLFGAHEQPCTTRHVLATAAVTHVRRRVAGEVAGTPDALTSVNLAGSRFGSAEGGPDRAVGYGSLSRMLSHGFV